MMRVLNLGVSVSDTIPAGLTFVSATGTGWACGQAAGVVTCTRATLGVGAAPDITLVLGVPAGYAGAGLAALPHFEMLPLATADVDRFLSQWFEILSGQRSDAPAPAHMLEAFKEQLANLTALVQENLSGTRVVRAYVQEDQEERKFAAQSREFVERNRKLIHLTGILYPGIQLLMGTGAVLVLGLGCTLAVRGRITHEQNFPFQAASWYWHFVDVVWLFVFTVVYLL